MKKSIEFDNGFAKQKHSLTEKRKESSLSIIEVQSRPDIVPLSFSQERLWFIDQLNGSVEYHLPMVFTVHGDLNTDAFEHAFQSIVNRHEVLRTVIGKQADVLCQILLEKNQWRLSKTDRIENKQNAEDIEFEIDELINKPFDLSQDHTLRAHLIRISTDEQILIVILHQIASDRWSIPLLFNELSVFYESYIQNRATDLPALQVQYADYSIWQRKYLRGERLDGNLIYWKEKLKDLIPLNLPVDLPRPVIGTTRGATTVFNFQKSLTEQLKMFGRRESSSLLITLLTAFKVLLYRYSGQEDISVGTPVSNRDQREAERLIGLLENTLTLRSHVTCEESFLELLHQVKETMLEAYQYKEAPFEKVVEGVVKERDLSRNPLFRVLFAFENTELIPELIFKGVRIIPQTFVKNTAIYDLELLITEKEDGLQCSLRYSTDLFTGETINRMLVHYEQLLKSIVREPSKKISTLTMVSDEELEQLLVQFNNTASDFPAHETVMHLFEQQVLKTPYHLAVAFEDEELSYQQLNKYANQLAHFLLQHYEVKANDVVGVMLNRSSWSAVVMIAIMKSGGCYLPIDCDLPKSRVEYILKDAKPKVILTSDHLLETYRWYAPGEWVSIQSVHLAAFSGLNPIRNIQLCALSYLIYTSGSTGMPKGVMQTHRTMLNLVQWGNQFSGIKHHSKLLQYASFAFDMSLYDVCFSITNGGTVYILGSEIRLDFPAIARYICKHELQILSFPFSVLQTFFETLDLSLLNNNKIEEIISTGEQLIIGSQLRNFLQLHPHIRIHNYYGPSETHVVTASIFAAGEQLPTRAPIGKPISNCSILILDKYHQPVPISVPGEIYIGGDNLARGYLNNNTLTSEKFIHHFFDQRQLVYKTGDLGRWLPDGSIEYLSRIDDQVKIRGYRVELTEIQTVLAQCELVSQTLVLTEEDNITGRRIICYVVPNGRFDQEGMLLFLKNRLPDYMIPVLWVELEKLPLTPNGKIDKKALSQFLANKELHNKFLPPRNEIENALATIWENVLGIKQISINDNFFELGGDSLNAMRVISRIRAEMEVELAVKDLFIHQTIEKLASLMTIFPAQNYSDSHHFLKKRTPDGNCLVPIQTEGSNNPFFVIHDFWLYKKLALYLGKHQPVYCLEASDPDNRENLASDYIRQIRMIQNKGPYRLGGFCESGFIAFEMARQLQLVGEKVSVLALIELYTKEAEVPKNYLRFYGSKLLYFIRHLYKLSFKEKWKYLSKELDRISKIAIGKFTRQLRKMKLIRDGSLSITPYAGNITLFKASNSQVKAYYKDNPTMGWSGYVSGEITVFEVEGDHHTIFKEPGVLQLAENLQKTFQASK
jgi:amino acid adenylation domain-containing protein